MEAFDIISEQYDHSHAANPHQVAASEELARRLPPASTVLDLGCGTGRPSVDVLTAAGHQVVGVDVSTRMLEIARRTPRPGAVFLHADLTSLTVPPARFDAVVAHFSLLMLDRAEIDQTLDRVADWLTPGGILSLAMVEFDGDAVPVDFLGVTVPVSGYLEDDLTSLLARHGFTGIAVDRVEFAPPAQPPEVQLYAVATRPSAERPRRDPARPDREDADRDEA